jgi:hypothetical protein
LKTTKYCEKILVSDCNGNIIELEEVKKEEITILR